MITKALKEKIVELEESMMDSVDNTKKDAKEFLHETYDKAKQTYHDLQQSAQSYLGHNLVKSLSVAFLMGIGLGKVL